MRTRSLFFTAALLAPLAPAVAAPASVRDQVQTLLAAVAPNPPREISRAVNEAKAAMKRADAHRSGAAAEAETLADISDKTALEWAQLAKDVGELQSLQVQADTAEKQLQELDAQVKREKAYLEETEARRGRALAALNQLQTVVPAPESANVPQTRKAGQQ